MSMALQRRMRSFRPTGFVLVDDIVMTVVVVVVVMQMTMVMVVEVVMMI